MSEAPKLDPQARALLERLSHSGVQPLQASSAPEARRLYRESRAPLAASPPEVAETRELRIPGAGGAIPARYYRALGAEAGALLPGFVYFHGGGWVCGDLDTHDVVCRGIANYAQCAVVAVDYRLAPEHKFPSAVEDAIAAVESVSKSAASLGIDAAKLIVGGESAGGNLAAVAAIAARDSGWPALAMQVLVYPSTDLGLGTASHERLATGYLLTRDSMLWYRGHYLRDERDIADWRASPLRAKDLSMLPPAYVITAGFDPLLDEGKAYADRLAEAGVPVTYECFEGQIHAFLPMGGVMAAANHAVYRIGQAVRSRFTRRTM